MTATLELSHTSKSYDQHVAVSDSRSLYRQAPSMAGSVPTEPGKTTTIRMVLNVIAPDSGRNPDLWSGEQRAGGH